MGSTDRLTICQQIAAEGSTCRKNKLGSAVYPPFPLTPLIRGDKQWRFNSDTCYPVASPKSSPPKSNAILVRFPSHNAAEHIRLVKQFRADRQRT